MNKNKDLLKDQQTLIFLVVFRKASSPSLYHNPVNTVNTD